MNVSSCANKSEHPACCSERVVSSVGGPSLQPEVVVVERFAVFCGFSCVRPDHQSHADGWEGGNRNIRCLFWHRRTEERVPESRACGEDIQKISVSTPC